MKDYVIVTDSGCDISPEILKEWDVKNINLIFRFDGEEKEYTNEEMDIKLFYDRMKKGETAKTSAINPESFTEFFDGILAQGKDVLYIGFSSGLSTTFNSSRIAAEELNEKYTENKVVCVDSLCASAGQGLLVYLAVQKKKSGATIDELATWISDNVLSVCHWFTVDDLVYLKRGGRVSPTVAFVGSVLGIKPILHVDDNGKLVSVSKVRGRKAAIAALADKYGELTDGTDNTVYISQADCEADAIEVKKQMEEKYGANVQIITNIGPVIGAHAGPGTIAVFFMGKER